MRRVVLALASVAALAGCATQTHAPAEVTAVPSPSPSAVSNHDAAVRDAAIHLGAFVPPAGAKHLAARPSGTALLDEPVTGLLLPYDIGRTTWWEAPGGPESLTRTIATPPGAKHTDSSSSGGEGGTAYGIVFAWPAVAHVFSERELEVTAQAVGARTVFRVDAITTWYPLRTPDTFIPAYAGAVTISYSPSAFPVTKAKPKTYGPVLISDQGPVDAVIAAVNADPIETAGVRPCPYAGGGHMDLAFHGSVPGSTVATVVINTDGCGDVFVEITNGKSVTLSGGPQLANTIMSITKLSWPRTK